MAKRVEGCITGCAIATIVPPLAIPLMGVVLSGSFSFHDVWIRLSFGTLGAVLIGSIAIALVGFPVLLLAVRKNWISIRDRLG